MAAIKLKPFELRGYFAQLPNGIDDITPTDARRLQRVLDQWECDVEYRGRKLSFGKLCESFHEAKRIGEMLHTVLTQMGLVQDDNWIGGISGK